MLRHVDVKIAPRSKLGLEFGKEGFKFLDLGGGGTFDLTCMFMG